MLIYSKKTYIKTTHSKHWLRKHPNLLSNKKVRSPEEVFVSDITLSDDMSTENVVQALKQAIGNKMTNKQTIHHLDRGLQYCSAISQNELHANNMIPSMIDGYDCYPNALAERMNGILKNEFMIQQCNYGQELQKLVDESIETYNQKRPHSSLNFQTPNHRHEKPEAIP